jgi:hypothetical protein
MVSLCRFIAAPLARALLAAVPGTCTWARVIQVSVITWNCGQRQILRFPTPAPSLAADVQHNADVVQAGLEQRWS